MGPIDSTGSMGRLYMGVEPKIGVFSPKMDGLFHGKPYETWMIWGGTIIFGNTHMYL